VVEDYLVGGDHGVAKLCALGGGRRDDEAPRGDDRNAQDRDQPAK